MNLFTARKKFITSLRLANSQGFTLIELLVVIGILGILAASLVATIDPFEQLKKANDSKTQNVAVEFQTGVVRYYTAQNGFPWDAAGNCKTDSGASNDVASDITTAVDLQVASTCIDSLIAVGELKQSFKDISGVLDKVFISEVGNQMVVCYQPTSRSGQKDKATKYTDNLGGQVGSNNCQANGGVQACYWCTR
jgi:prepilin-type N-terminal cleavage/methylation domain-containing protein